MSAATGCPAAVDWFIIAMIDGELPRARPCAFMCVKTGSRPVALPIVIVSSIALRELYPDSGVRRSWLGKKLRHGRVGVRIWITSAVVAKYAGL